jgi:hypothetical protein
MGTYAASPHPGHLVPSAYASCLICLICPFATGPFSIFFAAGPTAIFYTAWLSGCMACARARSPPPSRHTPFCIPVGRQAPPVPPASHFFCLRCIYLLSVICLPFLLCVCPLTGLCRKSITCNCRASARLASHAPPTPPVSDRPLVSPRAVDKPRTCAGPSRRRVHAIVSDVYFTCDVWAGVSVGPLRASPPRERISRPSEPHLPPAHTQYAPNPPFRVAPPHMRPLGMVSNVGSAPVVVSGTALRVHGSSL